MKEKAFISHLKKKEYDVGIQDGCGAPEWQIAERKPIACTCHLIDEGIDTGPIYQKMLFDKDIYNYYHMRFALYVRIAEFVVEVLSGLKIILPLSVKDKMKVYHIIEGTSAMKK